MSFGGSAFSSLTFGGHGTVVYELGATAITTAAPTVPALAFVRIINTASEEIATGSPTVRSPTIAQGQILTATGITTSAPVLGSANSGENERFFAGELSTTPVLGTSPIVQGHAIATGNLDSAAVSVPAIPMSESELFNTASITTSAPTVPTTALFVNIVLASSDIDTAASVIASTSFDQVQVFNTSGITTGGIDLGATPLVQAQTILGRTFDTPRPTFSNTTFEQDEKLEALFITTAPFDYPISNTMFEEETFLTDSENIDTGAPVSENPDFFQNHQIEQLDYTLGTPIIDDAVFLQDSILATPDLNYSIIIDTASFVENNILSFVPIATGQPLVPANTMFEQETFTSGDIITGLPTNSVSPINQTHIIPNQDDLNTDNSSLGTSAFNQDQTLEQQNLDARSHILGQPLFAYNYVFGAANIDCAPVSLPEIVMQENELFIGTPITTGQPVVDTTSSVINYNFSNPELRTGNPSVSEISMQVNHVMVAQPILTGNPVIPIQIYNAALGRIADFESSALGFAVLTIQSSNEVVLIENNTKADGSENDPNDAVLLVDRANEAVLAA